MKADLEDLGPDVGWKIGPILAFFSASSWRACETFAAIGSSLYSGKEESVSSCLWDFAGEEGTNGCENFSSSPVWIESGNQEDYSEQRNGSTAAGGERLNTTRGCGSEGGALIACPVRVRLIFLHSFIRWSGRRSNPCLRTGSPR